MSKFRVSDVVKTRDGREVEILKVDAPGLYPIIGMYLDDGYPSCWTHNGQFANDEYKRGADLLPPKRTRETRVWVNVYSDGEAFHATKEGAINGTFKSKALAVAVPCKITVEY